MSEQVLSDAELYNIFMRFYAQRRGRMFEIPLNCFYKTKDGRVYSWTGWRLEMVLADYGIDILLAIDYDRKRYVIVCVGGKTVHNTYTYTLKIPYEARSRYFQAIRDINQLADGVSSAFVNNIPYRLESYIVVETEKNNEKIEAIISAYKIERKNDKGLTEFIMEMKARKWDSYPFSKNEDAGDAFQHICFCGKISRQNGDKIGKNRGKNRD